MQPAEQRDLLRRLQPLGRPDAPGVKVVSIMERRIASSSNANVRGMLAAYAMAKDHTVFRQMRVWKHADLMNYSGGY